MQFLGLRKYMREKAMEQAKTSEYPVIFHIRTS